MLPIILCLMLALPAGSPGAASHFTVTPLADGVYAVIEADPLGLANHSNAVFIVGSDDVIVVDTQFTLHRTREVLDALRGITDKPVRTVINTHWHDDHMFGNQVYKEAFPNVEIIAHANTRADMETTGVENRAGQVAGGAEAMTMFHDAIEAKTALDGSPLSPDERDAYASTVAIAQEYLDEQPGFTLTLPTRTFTDQLTLRQGERVIEVRHFGPAVTRGDVIVYLPAEGVLAAGDLVDNPVPFAYGCNTEGWIAALDSIRALKPKTIVPGHGELVTDGGEQLARVLTALRDQARAAVANGESLDTARAHINVDDFRARMVSNNKMLGFIFDQMFVGPVMKSAFESAGGSE
ncbi:MAG TPA: MBL fold metallo-hydrolase [Candidatus Krumholzibacteria bacterium]|nr:MBL fold metallo-hydrolase [Candidatus Krumholzibacteria bacterium]